MRLVRSVGDPAEGKGFLGKVGTGLRLCGSIQSSFPKGAKSQIFGPTTGRLGCPPATHHTPFPLLPQVQNSVSERPCTQRPTRPSGDPSRVAAEAGSEWGRADPTWKGPGPAPRSCPAPPAGPVPWSPPCRLKGQPLQPGKGTRRHLGPTRLIISWRVSSGVAA